MSDEKAPETARSTPSPTATAPAKAAPKQAEKPKGPPDSVEAWRATKGSPEWWAAQKKTDPMIFAAAQVFAPWPVDPGHARPTLTEDEFDSAIKKTLSISIG